MFDTDEDYKEILREAKITHDEDGNERPEFCLNFSANRADQDVQSNDGTRKTSPFAQKLQMVFEQMTTEYVESDGEEINYGCVCELCDHVFVSILSTVVSEYHQAF